MTENNKQGQSWTDRIEVAGKDAVDAVKKALEEGNAKRVIIRGQDGKELLAVPLNVGVIGGGLVALSAPVLAAVTAVAGLVAQVKIDIVRELPAKGGAADESAPADETAPADGTEPAHDEHADFTPASDSGDAADHPQE